MFLELTESYRNIKVILLFPNELLFHLPLMPLLAYKNGRFYSVLFIPSRGWAVESQVTITKLDILFLPETVTVNIFCFFLYSFQVV